MPDPSLLYHAAAIDLSIHPFEGEDKTMDYVFRLVYSMVGAWILAAFNDRSMESDLEVSKTHVTRTAMDLINSYRKIDAGLGVYFDCEKDLDFVKRIEDAYVLLGFVGSGDYTYTPEPFRKKVTLSGKLSLNIDTYQKPMKMVGIAPIAPSQDIDSPLEDLFLCQKAAKETFEALEKSLDFQKFASFTKGKVEFYDPTSHNYKPYGPHALQVFGKLLLRLDGGGQYAILKPSSDLPSIGYLPNIYSRWENDEVNFGREGWRVILGYCASMGKPLKATVKPYAKGKGASTLVMKYISLPKTEEAILMCLGWPGRFATDKDYWIIPDETMPCVRKLLEHLSIEVEE